MAISADLLLIVGIAIVSQKQKFFLLGKANTSRQNKIATASNLHLRARAVVGVLPDGGSTEPPSAWAALRAAHAKVGFETERLIMVSLYNAARTYFQTKFE